jgi:hypothetical protein
MGRYYNGDIDGKFWFGVQASDDADFFGVSGYEPNYLEYNFEEDDLPAVEEGLKECYAELGANKERLDKFFKERKSYNSDQIVEYWMAEYSEDISDKVVSGLLMWYARLELGQKIYDCLKQNGQCEFRAEL